MPSKYKHTGIFLILLLIMTVRICSYFTLFPDSIGVTRVVKIALRFGMTGFSFVFYYFLAQKFPKFKINYENGLPLWSYMAYLGLGVLSLIWTTSVGFTALQLAMTIESLVFVWFYYRLLVVYNHFSGSHAPFSKILGYSIGMICVGFMIGLYFNPTDFYRDTHGGAVSRLGGFIINPNELGMLAVIGATMAYLEFFEHRNFKTNIAVLLASIAVLLLTQSRSSLGAFLLVTAICILYSGKIKLILASAVGASFAVPVLVNKIIIKEGDIGEVMSMTGRLPFWSDLLRDAFPQRPILGYGFMRISESSMTDNFYSIHAYAASMTHNTFIQVLINLGLVGAFIVLFQMIFTFNAIRIEKNKALKRLAILMFIPLFINSMTEFGIFGESNYGIMFYQFLIFLFFIKTPSLSPMLNAGFHHFNIKA